MVAGVSGATLSPGVILALGLGNLFADGFSMGVGDFLGERSEQKLRAQLGKATQDRRLWLTGVVTFLAFILAGSLPLIPYIMSIFGLVPVGNQFQTSIVTTGLALFGVGAVRTVAMKGIWWKNGLEVLLVGSIAAAIAYLVGAALRSMIVTSN